MNADETALRRLLESAAKAPDEDVVSPPFGFETRVVALWRAGANTGGNGIARLLRRVAAIAAAIILISSVASLRELRETLDSSEPGTNEYAIADSAIQQEFDQ